MPAELKKLSDELGKTRSVKRLAERAQTPDLADGPLEYQMVDAQERFLLILSFREHGKPPPGKKNHGLLVPPRFDILVEQKVIATAKSSADRIEIRDRHDGLVGEIWWRYSIWQRRVIASIAGHKTPIELVNFPWQLDTLVIRKKSGKACIVATPSLESATTTAAWGTHRLVEWRGNMADETQEPLENLFFFLIAHLVDRYEHAPAWNLIRHWMN
jgi:hypothetical protein